MKNNLFTRRKLLNVGILIGLGFTTALAIANTTGYWVVVLTIIPDCPTSIFEKLEQ